MSKNINTGNDTDLTYKDVYNWLDTVYGFNNSNQLESTILDILVIYVNAQKILCIESKTFCEQKLNTLMIPAIIISAITGLLSFIFKTSKYSPVIIATCSSFNSLLLALISYLKLDAKAEAHKTSAYKYDKLQSLCEFKSGRALLKSDKTDNNDNTNILKYIDDLELHVKEIKEINQFVIPEFIRYNYPYISTTNIFAVVKDLHYKEELTINNLKNKMNIVNSKKIYINGIIKEKQEIEEKLKLIIDNDDKRELCEKYEKNIDNYKLKLDQEYLNLNGHITDQNEALDEVLNFGSKYLDIDKVIKDELHHNITKSNNTWSFCGWLKS